jgi:hypothetical protein
MLVPLEHRRDQVPQQQFDVLRIHCIKVADSRVVEAQVPTGQANELRLVRPADHSVDDLALGVLAAVRDNHDIGNVHRKLEVVQLRTEEKHRHIV